MLRSLVVLFVFFVTVPSHAQNNWDAYQPARIDTLISVYESAIDRPRDTSSSSVVFNTWPAAKYSRLRVRATYTGEERPVDPDTRRLIYVWLKSRGADSTYVNLFETEVQFETSSGTYWFPMQSKPLSYMRREVPDGGMVELYVTFMGAYASPGEPLSWVFCVNEFQN
jgi:hypothetical protein